MQSRNVSPASQFRVSPAEPLTQVSGLSLGVQAEGEAPVARAAGEPDGAEGRGCPVPEAGPEGSLGPGEGVVEREALLEHKAEGAGVGQ